MTTLHVRIVTPVQTLFEGSINSVSSANSSGQFDILPGHANFITIIENKPIILRSAGQRPLAFHFPLAIIFTSLNQVNIYTYSQK